MNSLYILDIKYLSNIWFIQIFPPTPQVEFHFFDDLFCVQKLFSLCSPTCDFYFLLLVILVSYLKIYCQNQCQLDLSLGKTRILILNVITFFATFEPFPAQRLTKPLLFIMCQKCSPECVVRARRNVMTEDGAVTGTVMGPVPYGRWQ